MADIQSAAAEIRLGKKRRRRTNHSMKIYMVSLFHRETINKAERPTLIDFFNPGRDEKSTLAGCEFRTLS